MITDIFRILKKGRDMETLYLQGPKPRKVKKEKDEEEE